jgi:hypothetical protein
MQIGHIISVHQGRACGLTDAELFHDDNLCLGALVIHLPVVVWTSSPSCMLVSVGLWSDTAGARSLAFA